MGLFGKIKHSFNHLGSKIKGASHQLGGIVRKADNLLNKGLNSNATKLLETGFILSGNPELAGVIEGARGLHNLARHHGKALYKSGKKFKSALEKRDPQALFDSGSQFYKDGQRAYNDSRDKFNPLLG